MSATRDKTQKIAFVYSNLYQIYRKGVSAAGGKATAPEADLGSPHFAVMNRGQVLKPAEATAENPVKVRSEPPFENRIEEYRPAEFLAKRIVQRPDAIRSGLAAKPAAPQTAALNSLKDNLKSLNELHSRLRFMLQELEDLVKD